MPSRLTPAIRLACTGVIGTALWFPSAAQAGPDPKTALTHVQVRIEVDAAGQVVSAEPTSGLPPPLVDTLRQHASTWKFEPPQRDGTPVGGTTFARMSVCAMENPATGNLSVSVGHPENGPGMDPRMLRPSFFPPVSPELLALGRVEMEAVYEVGPDGHAQVVSVGTTPHRPRVHRELDRAFRKWIDTMRFEPERVDGKPVATRMRMPITFTWERSPGVASRRELERRIIEASPTCQALLQDQAAAERPQVALDSPFRATPPG